jgi:hypothetical protein
MDRHQEDMMNQQRELAQALVDELKDCGHTDVNTLDLLDALASCGYELVESTTVNADGVGPAAAAYFDALSKTRE